MILSDIIAIVVLMNRTGQSCVELFISDGGLHSAVNRLYYACLNAVGKGSQASPIVDHM